METVNDILRDIRARAEVACRQDEDATIHHSAVAAMLHDLADRIEAAFNRFCESKRSFYCTNTECPIRKALSEMMTKGEQDGNG